MKVNKIYSIDANREKLGELNIGIGINLLKNFLRRIEKRLFILAVCWQYHNNEGDLREVEIFEKEKNLFAYPSPDMKYMVVLFDRNSEYYPYPNNLVVFYPNGKIKHIVGLPDLISKYAIINANNPMGVDKKGSFENVWWNKKDNEKIMTIAFCMGEY